MQHNRDSEIDPTDDDSLHFKWIFLRYNLYR